MNVQECDSGEGDDVGDNNDYSRYADDNRAEDCDDQNADCCNGFGDADCDGEE